MSTESQKTILFVDSENVGKIDLSAVPTGMSVAFFCGAAQKSVPTEVLKAAVNLRDRFIHTDIEGQGKNALDFHIAFYLGEYLEADAHVSCVILSKDKGFDPLVKHLRGRGFSVRRAATLPDALGATARTTVEMPVVDASSAKKLAFEDVVQFLKKMQARVRPLKRKGLLAHLKSHFKKRAHEAEIDKMVDRLFAEKKLKEVAGKLEYQL